MAVSVRIQLYAYVSGLTAVRLSELLCHPHKVQMV